MMKFRINTILIIASVIISGCASYAPETDLNGKDRSIVVANMGTPTRVNKSESGNRLVYARGPYGRHTYFVDLDVNDRVIAWKQVLNEENFSKIKPGFSTAQVEAIIGPSTEKTTLARDRGYVWSYRFQTISCTWFQIEFTPDNMVRSTGYGFPPECWRIPD